MKYLIFLTIVVMSVSSSAMGGEWRSHFADPANTGRAQVAGPDDPGLKWHIDLADVETSFAPDGYGVGTNSQLRRPLVAPDGTLIVAAKNNNPQYPNRLSEGREVIGIDPDNGEVIWEIPHASTDHQRCRPALDSQGRLWVHQARERYDMGGPWAVQAFDPATGEAIPDTRFITSWPDEDIFWSTCRRTQLHIGGEGEHEHLAMYGNGGDPEDVLVLDISGTEPEIVVGGIFGTISIAGVPGGSYNPRIGAFSDDSLFIAFKGSQDHLVLLQIPLDTNDPIGQSVQQEVPTPADSHSTEYSRAEMVVADNDTLIVSGVGSDGFVAALNIDQDMSLSWLQPMPDGSRARDLTIIDGLVLAHPGTRTSSFGGNPMMALSIDDGSIVWNGGVETGSATIADTSTSNTSAMGVDGNFFTSTREGSMTRDRLIVSASGLDGEPDWIIRPDAIMEAAGVDELEDLGLFDFASLQMGPIDHDGVLYITNDNNATTGILAIDNSGGLSGDGDIEEPAEQKPWWSNYFGDPSQTSRAKAPGPDDPGLKWNIDLADVDTSFAPDGYGFPDDMDRPLVGPNGTLIMYARNNNAQYPNRHRYGREVIGIDPDDGSVIWEIPFASTDHRKCRPTLDSQGRLWVHQSNERYDTGGPWAVQAFEPATGLAIPDTRFITEWPDENINISRCHRTHLHIGGEGENERLVMYGRGGDPGDLLVLDISGTTPQPVITGISGPDRIQNVPLNSFQRRIGVMTDDSLFIAVRVESGHIELLRIPLDAGPIEQMEMPTPEGSNSTDYGFRVRMAVSDNSTLIISPSPSEDGAETYIAAIDLDGEMSTSWVQTLPATTDGARDLTLVDDVILTRTSGGWRWVRALSVETGDILWSDSVEAASRIIADMQEGKTDIIFQDNFANYASGHFYTSGKDSGSTDNLMISKRVQDGQRRWVIEPSSVVEAAGVNELEDLGLFVFGDLQFGPIDQDGTLYVTNSNNTTSGMLAIDNSGGLVE